MINDGHYDGLEVCYEDSYDEGYDQGYSEYMDGYEYNQAPESYQSIDATSYEKGYAEGWSVAESEYPESDEDNSINESSNSTDEPDGTSDNALISPQVKQQIFDEGYDIGFEMAKDDYMYDASYDGNWALNDEELVVYKEGYFAGYIEGGGGTFGEKIYYYGFQKNLFATVSVGTLILLGIIFLLIKRRKNKQTKESNSKAEGKMSGTKWTSLLIGVLVISVVSFYIIVNGDESEPVDSEAPENPYSYTSVDHDCDDFETQEDAQLFYEANGGPDEDPHDLDRDNDGMACDWNP